MKKTAKKTASHWRRRTSNDDGSVRELNRTLNTFYLCCRRNGGPESFYVYPVHDLWTSTASVSVNGSETAAASLAFSPSVCLLSVNVSANANVNATHPGHECIPYL